MSFKGFGKFLVKAGLWAAGHTSEIEQLVKDAKSRDVKGVIRDVGSAVGKR